MKNKEKAKSLALICSSFIVLALVGIGKECIESPKTAIIYNVFLIFNLAMEFILAGKDENKIPKYIYIAIVVGLVIGIGLTVFSLLL